MSAETLHTPLPWTEGVSQYDHSLFQPKSRSLSYAAWTFWSSRRTGR